MKVYSKNRLNRLQLYLAPFQNTDCDKISLKYMFSSLSAPLYLSSKRTNEKKNCFYFEPRLGVKEARRQSCRAPNALGAGQNKSNIAQRRKRAMLALI